MAESKITEISYEGWTQKEKENLNWYNHNLYSEEKFIPDFKWPSSVLNFLHEAANSVMGRNLTYNPVLKGFSLIEGTCFFPCEPNFIVTRNYFMDNEISNCDDVVSVFLAKYGFRPYRMLRKLFQKDPEVLIKFLLLKRFGFKNNDVITSLLTCENFHKIYKSIYFNRRNETYQNGFSFFMNSMLESKSEVSAAGFLKKLNLSQGYVEDCVNMFHSYYEKLTPEFKNSMFREGFTEYNHNVLARISYNTRHEKVVFKYTDEQRELEDEIDGYQFLLPEDSDRLIEIGEKMHNCVASYKNRILSKRCTIVYAVKDGVYSVCIELTDGRAVQELCDRNKKTDMAVRALLLKWHEKHGIKSCMRY